MKELNLLAYKTLPQAFFNEAPFEKTIVMDNSIIIDNKSWIPFQQNILKLLSGDVERNKDFIVCMKCNLQSFQHYVCNLGMEFRKTGRIPKSLLEKCLSMYSICQGYAFFNDIPITLLKEVYNEAGLELDNLMIPLCDSHRTIKRRKELSLCLKYLSGALTLEDIESYRINEYILSKESNWHFYSEELDNARTIKWEIKKICQHLTAEEIKNELEHIEKRRTTYLNKIYSILNDYIKLDAAKYYQCLLMINIATQEEYRHIVNSHFMYEIGKLSYYADIDIARSDVNTIVNGIALAFTK